MGRQPGQPIDSDQNQFMQENAQQVSNASIPFANNANAPAGSSAGNPPQPGQPKGAEVVAPPENIPQPSSQAMNTNSVITTGLDYFNPQNEDTILKGIFAGQPLSVKSPVIDQARQRYSNYNTLSSLTPDQLGDFVLSGKIGVGSTDLTDLKNFNPELYAQTTQYITNKKNMNQINDMGMGIYNAMMKGTPISSKIKYNVADAQPETSDLMAGYNEKIQKMVTSKFGPEAQKFYSMTQELLNNPQVQSQKTKITELEGRKNKLNEDIFNLDNDVRKTLGSEAPESLISSYIGEQTKAISKQVRTIDNELSVEQANLENYLNEVNTTLEYIKTGWTADNSKKKSSGSGSGSGGGSAGIEKLYEDRVNGSVAGGELFNDATLKRYGLKGHSKGEIIQALSELGGSTQDIGGLLTKASELTPQYGDEFSARLPKSIVTKQASNYVKYIKENSDDRKTDVADALQGMDKTQASKVLDEAGVKGGFFNRITGKGGKNTILKNIK